MLLDSKCTLWFALNGDVFEKVAVAETSLALPRAGGENLKNCTGSLLSGMFTYESSGTPGP